MQQPLLVLGGCSDHTLHTIELPRALLLFHSFFIYSKFTDWVPRGRNKGPTAVKRGDNDGHTGMFNHDT